MVVSMDKFERQLAIEKQAYDYSYDRMIREVSRFIDNNEAHELHEGKIILVAATDAVAHKITEMFDNTDIRGIGLQAKEFLGNYYGKPKDLAYIVISSIVQTISKDNYVVTTVLIRKIVSNIINDLALKELNQEFSTLNAYVDKVYKGRSKRFRINQKLRIVSSKSEINTETINGVTLRIGTILLDCVLKSSCNIIKVNYLYNKGKSNQVITYTEECFRMVTQSRETLLNSYKKYPIHIIPPKPWESFNDSGGYHNVSLYKLNMIKCYGKNKKLIKDYFEKKPDAIGKLIQVLNIIQQTKWKVNTKVFDVVKYIVDNNIVDYNSARNNPYLIGHLPYQDTIDTDEFVNKKDFGETVIVDGFEKFVDTKDFSKYNIAKEQQESINATNIGKAIGLKLALNDCEEYIDEPEIFFSYQFDFRSRIYPIQQHLHPQGNGVMKALLHFVEGCKIENEEQLNWFLIHGANCYGYDKEEYEDRITKIKEKHEEIIAVAKSPMEHKAFWKDADEPFLYLAWCFEYADYIANPSEFISHLPIGLDATCSGIQIYSGLLLDGEGAEAVNVIGNTRQDIYRKVSDKVNSYLEVGDYNSTITYTTADNQEHIIDVKEYINEIKGKITRGIVKRNVMTQPYSVTKFGMYNQLREELEDMRNNNKQISDIPPWILAKILVPLNDRAIVEVVKGARIGQNFLKEVTADLVKGGKYVFYLTPYIKFPVLQKIQKIKIERIITEIGKLVIKQPTEEIHQVKMVNGIAPNFIHSLDATLLMMTMLKLYDVDCRSFHFIHDQYGVLVNQIPNLNKAVREAYVELFSLNPLQMFISQVYKGQGRDSSEVMLNTLDLKDVLKSRYIFS